VKALASPTDQREGEFWGVKSDSETIFKGGSFASFSKRKGGREARAGIIAIFISMCSYL